jgi:hypothetical protein
MLKWSYQLDTIGKYIMNDASRETLSDCETYRVNAVTKALQLSIEEITKLDANKIVVEATLATLNHALEIIHTAYQFTDRKA